MEVVYPCCCGLDVHKASITACVLWAEGHGRARKRSGDSGRLPRISCNSPTGCSAAASRTWRWKRRASIGNRCGIFSTASLRRCCSSTLSTSRPFPVGRRIRRTVSFVPPQATRELHDLTRSRVSLAQECNRIANRIQKVMDANLKLASVATDALGASGARIILTVATPMPCVAPG